jgi:alkylation response protein AidB-like acyl-CoA dehydrogenase
LPGAGQTAERHRRLLEVGREDLSLARLAEAHWDALAILSEAGKKPESQAIYGVWASETPGSVLSLEQVPGGHRVNGLKRFCSGAGLIDRALVTVGSPLPQLVDMDLRILAGVITFDSSAWKTSAFAQTKTAVAAFENVLVTSADFVGGVGWYLNRAGFWHGACAPAACWAGGAVGLVDYALQQTRNDAHTLAHLGAMQAQVWALQAYLEQAGHQIDAAPMDVTSARIRARTVRHLVEQACTDVLRRLARAYGPHPMAMREDISQRYQELDLYVRQSHAERDLEALGCEFLPADK